jgi:hypothetical protein
MMRSQLKFLLPSFVWVLIVTPATWAAPVLTIAVTSNTDQLSLDGTGSSKEHIVKAADLAITTDSPNGYTLTVSSGDLNNPEQHTPIAFQVTTVMDGAAAPGAAEFTTPSGSIYSVSTESAGQADRDLYIKYSPAGLQDPGRYTASLSLVVTDN